MRPFKIVGPMVVAALASMTLLGVSSASATSTALCSIDATLVCAAGNIYTGHIEAVATNLQIKSSVGNVHCEHATFLGNALGLANPLLLHIELSSFINCLDLTFGTGCTITAEELGLWVVLKTAPNLAEAKLNSIKVRLNCPSLGLNCVYTKPATALHIVGSTLPLVSGGTTSLAKITATEVSLENTGGGFCPATSKWTATYFIQLPHEIFIAE
jgi:hypothetical protein